MTKEKILILGSYGRGNAGDDALLSAMLKLFENFSIVINSANDSSLPKGIREKIITIQTHGISDIFKKIKIFFQIKYVVYGGGDVWVELYGERFPRINLCKMLIVNFVCRIFGKKIFYFGCGAGDIFGLSLLLAKTSAQLANYVIARDLHTINLLKIKNIIELPDLTVNLFENNKVSKNLDEKNIYVGISLLYYLPNPNKNFISLVKEFQKLFLSFDGANIRFIIIPFFISNEVMFDDLWVAKKLFGDGEFKNVEIFNSNKIEDILALLPRLNLMVGTRLHANILAVFSGIPSLGIAYRPKVRSFFHQNNLDKFCIEIDEISRIIPKVSAMLDDKINVKNNFLRVQQKIIKKRVKYEEIIKKLFV